VAANVNAVVERVVETVEPVPPETEVVTTATVYDYPVADADGYESVVTLSEEEHLQVVHAPDPTTAFDLIVEARDADHDEPDEPGRGSTEDTPTPELPQDFGPPVDPAVTGAEPTAVDPVDAEPTALDPVDAEPTAVDLPPSDVQV
jgi:hypothetical protein